MSRPVQSNGATQAVFFSEKNYRTLQTVLMQDFQERNGAPLTDQQVDRLSKTLEHYLNQVYEKQGNKPIPVLNKEVLSTTAKDFSQYLQRKEITKNTNPIKKVMDDGLFQETSQRFERLTQERNEVKALPPSTPDFRISLTEDGPPAAEMFERAKKQREMEMLRSAQQSTELMKAEAGLQGRVQADSSFRTQQDQQNRNMELVLSKRTSAQASAQPPFAGSDVALTVLPDRRELLLAPIGSFDTMTGSPDPRGLGQANANPTIVEPQLASPAITHLPQNYVVREDKVVSYREIESNLFIYSADRDWLRNNKENRYQFTVNFDPAANGQSFGPNLASQQKFKNIVRIELVKAIIPGEGLDVSVICTNTDPVNTGYQDNILNMPYVIVRVAELENNNYGTDNFLDRSFGVLQYDATWISDTTTQSGCSKGFLAMIPKFLKCQKEYYPTPLSTLQKMTIELLRPNGELISNSPDTFNIGGIIANTTAAAPAYGTVFPFTVDTSGSKFSVPVTYMGFTDYPCNFFINTVTYFSRFEICVGDRIQISGYSYSDAVLNDPTYGQSFRAFSNWINRPEGHLVIGTAFSDSSTSTSIQDNRNGVGYANFIVIQTQYQDPSTGSIDIKPFGTGFNGNTLNAFGIGLQSPIRLINLNKQLNLVFRIITREMDSLPQIRPDNNY
jgi:hypothetical protein